MSSLGRTTPLSSYDADFTDGQAETAISIPRKAVFCTVDVTGSDVWIVGNTSNGSKGLSSSPATKSIKILKDWVLPFPMQLMDYGQDQVLTHFKFIPVAGAAGHITVNFFE